MSEDVVTQLKPGQYRVMRTSSYGESPEPPCDGAYQIRVTRVDRRLTDDPKKVPSGRGTDEWWYDRGTNHRVEDGCICRDLGVDTLWAVDVPDLVEFVRDSGQIVLYIEDNGMPVIEIYDGYRE